MGPYSFYEQARSDSFIPLLLSIEMRPIYNSAENFLLKVPEHIIYNCAGYPLEAEVNVSFLDTSA